MKLSIITINLNNYNGLKKTMESVISQSYKDFEYVVIDGGSDDGSIEVIKGNTGNLAYWISEKDSGIYNAMNKGIRQAKGEYCLFLNSGDRLYDEDVLSEVFREDFTEDLVYGDQLTEDNGIYKISPFLYPEYITFNSFYKSTLPHQCTFVKRKLFGEYGLYNEKNKIVSDWEWNTLALFRYNCSIKKIDIPIAVYNLSGISNNKQFLELQEQEKRNSVIQNFPRIGPDTEEYFHLLKRYKKIPRLISSFFNKI